MTYWPDHWTNGQKYFLRHKYRTKMEGSFSRCMDTRRGFRCEETKYLDQHGHCISHCDIADLIQDKLRALSLDGKLTPDKVISVYKKYDAHFIAFHGVPAINTHTGNGLYQGAFAFTLTKSPDDDLTEDDMIKAVEKVLNQKSCPVKKFAWYLEYGDLEEKRHPHIHGMYETESSGRIEAKHWKRAWRIWDEKTRMGNGFRGGYHRPVRDDEAYDDYIRKQNGRGGQKNISPA